MKTIDRQYWITENGNEFFIEFRRNLMLFNTIKLRKVEIFKVHSKLVISQTLSIDKLMTFKSTDEANNFLNNNHSKIDRFGCYSNKQAKLWKEIPLL